MTGQPTTQSRIGAQRFLARRMAHALVLRDVSMHDDPLRMQSASFAIGCVLAAVAVGACAVLGVMRPQGVPASASIVMANDSGALYVRVEDILHPVLNLASARLIARSAAGPVAASETAIARAKRGPLMGIPGAPATIGAPLGDSSWTVCDGDRTLVAAGNLDLGGFDATRPVLVTPRGESAATTYLLYDGHRAEVDLRSLTVVRALRLDGVVPVAVSRTLLDVVPEVPAISVPHISAAGDAGPATLGRAPIGTVVRVRRADLTEHYVVLRDGLQSVGEVAADLIRFAYDRTVEPVATVAPAVIAALPAATSLPVSTYPQHARPPVGTADARAVCAQWRPGGSTSSNTIVLSGDSSHLAGWDATVLAQADGEGLNIDAIVMPRGVGAYVRAAGIVGDDGAAGARFLVSDAGVLFGVHDDEAASFLGLGLPPQTAPWPVLAQLPRGPELSVDAASVTRDGFPTPS